MLGKILKLCCTVPCLIFGRFLVIRCRRTKTPLEQADSLFVHPHPNLGRVIREDYIIDACKGKRVLHFGFLDNPITIDKISRGTLLHTRILGVASSLYGADLNEASLADYRRLTGDTENTVKDLLQSDSDVSFLSGRFDVILFPEVLEHIANPGIALTKLKEILRMNPGSILLVSVPNAYSIQHFISACNSVELVHADHYYYFSPVTLRKLLIDCGFGRIDIILYSHNKGDIGAPGITEHGVIALCQA